jgi:hypothetical protein
MVWNPKESNFSMDESQTNNIHQISNKKNAIFIAPYIEEEVKKVVSK